MSSARRLHYDYVEYVRALEMSSKSTEDYDRGEKLSQYKQLPSLAAVLFVSHRARRVTLIERVGATVRSPALEFPVDALYDGITLDAQ